MPSLPREEGQGLVEYALILMLVAVAIVMVLGIMGQELAVFFQSITDAFPG